MSGKRVVVLGAGGMLGHKVCQVLSATGKHRVIGTVRKDPSVYRQFGEVFSDVRLVGDVDVEDGSLEGRLAELEPDAIVNAVGIVKQLDAAHNRCLSVAINSWLPHRLARWCAGHGARLVHLSTDCVFDGERGSYTEDDPSNAADLYGQSKYLGETDESETAAITLRTSIIGRELARPTHGLIEWFLAQRGRQIRGFVGAIYSGFTTLEMARVIRSVIDDHGGLCGTFHVASEPINKYILLQSIRRILRVEIEIREETEFRCDRSLVMQRFAEATGYRAPSWDDMILEMREDPTPYDIWLGHS